MRLRACLNIIHGGGSLQQSQSPGFFSATGWLSKKSQFSQSMSRMMANDQTQSVSSPKESVSGQDEDDDIKSEDIRWDAPPEMPRFNVSFAGCGFLGIYHLGVAQTLVQHGRGFLQCVEKFGGASAGALVATLLATRDDEEAVQSCIKFLYESAGDVYKKKMGLLTPGVSILDDLEKFIEDLLPENAHELASDRLFISLTKGRKNYLISQYETREDLIKCMLGSSYVPHITGKKPVVWKGKKYVDGGMTENLPYIPGARNIKVSPFSGGQEISPKDKKGPRWTHWVININGQDFQVHHRNLIRGLHAFFPPRVEHLKSYFDKGVRDAEIFLKKENFYDKEPRIETENEKNSTVNFSADFHSRQESENNSAVNLQVENHGENNLSEDSQSNQENKKISTVDLSEDSQSHQEKKNNSTASLSEDSPNHQENISTYL